MTVDDAGQTLYLTRGDNEVVAVDLATGQLNPFAGTAPRDSPATAARRATHCLTALAA